MWKFLRYTFAFAAFAITFATKTIAYEYSGDYALNIILNGKIIHSDRRCVRILEVDNIEGSSEWADCLKIIRLYVLLGRNLYFCTVSPDDPDIVLNDDGDFIYNTYTFLPDYKCHGPG